MRKEIWKDIPGKRNHQASSKGRIRRKAYTFIGKKRSKNGKPFKVKYCFKAMLLTNSIHNRNNNGNTLYLATILGLTHRIVASAFLPNPKNKREINHKDGNGMNNNIENLEWATPRENQKHAYKTGLRKPNNLRGKGGKFARRF